MHACRVRKSVHELAESLERGENHSKLCKKRLLEVMIEMRHFNAPNNDEFLGPLFLDK